MSEKSKLQEKRSSDGILHKDFCKIYFLRKMVSINALCNGMRLLLMKSVTIRCVTIVIQIVQTVRIQRNMLLMEHQIGGRVRPSPVE